MIFMTTISPALISSLRSSPSRAHPSMGPLNRQRQHRRRIPQRSHPPFPLHGQRRRFALSNDRVNVPIRREGEPLGHVLGPRSGVYVLFLWSALRHRHDPQHHPLQHRRLRRGGELSRVHQDPRGQQGLDVRERRLHLELQLSLLGILPDILPDIPQGEPVRGTKDGRSVATTVYFITGKLTTSNPRFAPCFAHRSSPSTRIASTQRSTLFAPFSHPFPTSISSFWGPIE